MIGGSANQANYITNTTTFVYSVTQSGSYSATQNYLTDAGAFTQSGSYYGTFDQGGNAFEWNDGFIGSSRSLRGGSWGDYEQTLQSSGRFVSTGADGRDLGFRVATVPEPASASLLGLGALLLATRRRRSA